MLGLKLNHVSKRGHLCSWNNQSSAWLVLKFVVSPDAVKLNFTDSPVNQHGVEILAIDEKSTPVIENILKASYNPQR